MKESLTITEKLVAKLACDPLTYLFVALSIGLTAYSMGSTVREVMNAYSISPDIKDSVSTSFWISFAVMETCSIFQIILILGKVYATPVMKLCGALCGLGLGLIAFGAYTLISGVVRSAAHNNKILPSTLPIILCAGIELMVMSLFIVGWRL